MLGYHNQNLLSFIFIYIAKSSAQFGQSDEVPYLQNFDSIQAASYSVIDDPDANLPPDLLSVCKDKDINPPAREVVVQTNATNGLINSSTVSTQCGGDSICVIPFGTTLQVDTSLSLAALIVKGVVEWTDDTQVNPSAFMCAGYIAVEGFGKWEMDVQTKDSFVYIKDNGAVHPMLRSRSFGSTAMNIGDYPTINISGRELARTWSLLSKPLHQGDDTVQLMHNPNLMGWRVGDRIAVAPTAKLATGHGEEFTITSIQENGSLLLDKVSQHYHQSQFVKASSGAGGHPALLSAEVINLSRNIVITGDDFKHEQCDPSLPETVPGEETSVLGCRCSSFRQQCTIGLHTAAMNGGTASIQNVRVERCGQRGVEGKYCLHFHKLQDCPTCLFKNNVVENSHQRGIIVHSTHSSVVEGNVLYNIRGSGIYIEDGNEMYNDIKYNVVICPYPFLDGVLSGCTVPGTSNRIADTKDNQSGIFSRANTNSLQGNRVSNNFNGMLFQNQGSGRGDSQNKVCESSALLGRIEGNTFQSNGRFGFYMLNSYPKETDQSILSDGHNIDKSLCSGFDSEGNARGASGAIVNNFDYFNAFVGHYEAGDIQYNGHQSFDNNNLMYWKETKNFENGCSVHITGSMYAHGNIALPDQATFIIENTQFGNSVSLEANHHCNVGVTGGLCQPTYILDSVRWKNKDTSKKWVWFQRDNLQPHNANQNYGGIFTLAPPDADIVMNGLTYDDSLFPEGFVSLVSWQYTYLLDLPGEPCILSSTISAEAGLLYDNSILCKVPLRSLKVWSRGLDPWTAPAPGLQVEFWFKRGGGVDSQVTTPDSTQVIGFHQIGSNSPKQGFSFPVIPGIEHSYRLSLTTGDREVPSDWIVEFSDTVMGNRYSVEYTYLSLNGRRCGLNGLVSSQHYRSFIWSGGEFLKDEAWGNTGACSIQGTNDVPIIDCSSINDGVLQAQECPEKCAVGCESNYFCDCGSSTCKPRQGFVEETAIDLCDAARCENGHCSATFLGGSLPVNSNACVCDEGWSGPLCQYNPCATLEKTCSGHGTCVALSDVSATCHCDQGFSGEECEVSCDEVCSGEWPYGCEEDLGPDIVKYGCRGAPGCFYLRKNEEYPFDDVCTYKEGFPNQKGCLCDNQNDCILTLPCNPDGSCPTSESVPDNTPCNSVPFGQCQSGTCQERTNQPQSPSRSTPTLQPTAPLQVPTIHPTHLPTRQPSIPLTPKPSHEQTYCGCSQCTQAVWDALACNDSLDGCHTCGSRILWVKSINGGNAKNACQTVANEFPNDSCGVCHPGMCNVTEEATKTKATSPPPTPSPS